MKACKHFGPHR